MFRQFTNEGFVMKKILLPFLFCSVILSAKILKVPSDHPAIQSAINSAVNGDTVVVFPGTYFENINFLGKNIVVTSRYYENADPQFILSTILNGSQPKHPDTASCVLIVSGENEGAVLQGFTVTGGKGTRWTDEHGAGVYREGGGILITLSSPVIRHNYILNNEIFNGNNVLSTGGGGIRVGDGSPLIEHNVITLNKALYGGGIVLNYCSGAIVRNNMIVENSVRQYIEGKQGFGGGGLWIGNPEPGDSRPNMIVNNTIFGNEAMDNPNASGFSGRGGAMVIHSNVNVVVKNNIIWENHSSFPIASVAVLNANVTTEYNNIMFGFPGQGNIATDPMFADSSFLLQPSSPAIDAGDTGSVYFDPHFGINPELAVLPARGTKRNDLGAYGGPAAKHFFAFSRPSLFTPLPSHTFLYRLAGDSASIHVYLGNFGASPARLDSVSITTPDIRPGFSVPRIVGVNSSEYIHFHWKPTATKRYVDTLRLFHNSTFKPNPLIVQLNANSIPTPLMEVNTNEHNFGTLDINTIAKDTTITIYNRGTGKDSVLLSLVPGVMNPPSAVQLSASVLSIPPGDSLTVTFTFYPRQIVKTFLGNYAPKILFKSVRGEDTTTREKIMRFRLTGTLGVGDRRSTPWEYSLSPNYPNPFNPTTTIVFSLREAGDVSLTVFDLLGRTVAEIVHEQLDAGEHRVNFSAEHLASGIYYYTLRAGSFTATHKMTLLK